MIGYPIEHKQTGNANWFLYSGKNSGFEYEYGARIAKVLAQVRYEFYEIFGAETLSKHPTLSVVHTSDSPSTFRCTNIIFLSSNKGFHQQQIYQFAHELCHFIVPDTVCQSFRWFEETLCEAMSWYVLHRINDRRETAPCRELTLYYSTIDKYIQDSMDKRLNLNGCPVAIFIATQINHLVENCYDRAANSAVAYELFPLLLSNPEIWRIVPLLHNADDRRSFRENLSALIDFANISSGVKTSLLQLLCV